MVPFMAVAYALILESVDDPHRLYRAPQPVSTATTPPEMCHRQPTVAVPPAVSAAINGPPWLD